MAEANIRIAGAVLTPNPITVGKKFVISVDIINKDILLAANANAILIGTGNTAIKVKENK